jgi:hypothetical protein
MNSRGFSLSRAAAILGVSFIGGTVCAVILTLGHSPETKPATFFGLDPSADSPRSARGSFTQTSFSSLRNVVTSNWPTRAATGHLRNLLGWSSGRGDAIAPRLEDHRPLSVAAHAAPPPAEYPAPGSGTLSGPLAGQAAQPGYQLLELPKELGVLPQPDTPPAAMPLVAPSQGPETLARFSLPDSPRDARQPDAVLTAGTTPEPVAAQQPDKPAGQSPSASPDPAVSEPAVPIVGSGERMEMASPESLRALVERVQPDPGGSPGRVVDEPKPRPRSRRHFSVAGSSPWCRATAGPAVDRSRRRKLVGGRRRLASRPAARLRRRPHAPRANRRPYFRPPAPRSDADNRTGSDWGLSCPCCGSGPSDA